MWVFTVFSPLNETAVALRDFSVHLVVSRTTLEGWLLTCVVYAKAIINLKLSVYSLPRR